MVNFGSIWEEKLIELWNNESISLTGIARKLNVDPLTIKKYATKLNLSFERKNKSYKKLDESVTLKGQEEIDFEKLLFEKRQDWIRLVTSNPKSKLKELRSLKPRLYAWLIENDSNWLTKHLPKKNIKTSKTKIYVDWHKRDLELSQALKVEAGSMLSGNLRPKQITKTALGKKTDSLALILTKLDKLPLTTAVLSTLIESREECAIRKIKWVANNFKDQKLFPSKSQLITSACVFKIRENPLIKRVIDQEFNRFTKQNY